MHRALPVLALGALVTYGCSSATTRRSRAVITFAPLAVEFGSQIVGTTATQELVLSNGGSFVLLLSLPRILGDTRTVFRTSPIPSQIEAGASVHLKVIYLPTAEGADGASLVLESNADNAPEVRIPLAGHAAAATCTDGVLDGRETDVDCGGKTCSGCGDGKKCGTLADCAAGLSCIVGRCAPCITNDQCLANFTCRAGRCTPCDIQNDVDNCGACDHVCPTPVHAIARCVQGVCGRGPCAQGSFDLGDGAGCDWSCVGRLCTNGAGKTIPVSNPVLPETGTAFQTVAAGSSYGARKQVGRSFVNIGVLAEPTPPNAQGASEQTGTHFVNVGGVNASRPP